MGLDDGAAAKEIASLKAEVASLRKPVDGATAAGAVAARLWMTRHYSRPGPTLRAGVRRVRPDRRRVRHHGHRRRERPPARAARRARPRLRGGAQPRELDAFEDPCSRSSRTRTFDRGQRPDAIARSARSAAVRAVRRVARRADPRDRLGPAARRLVRGEPRRFAPALRPFPDGSTRARTRSSGRPGPPGRAPRPARAASTAAARVHDQRTVAEDRRRMQRASPRAGLGHGRRAFWRTARAGQQHARRLRARRRVGPNPALRLTDGRAAHRQATSATCADRGGGSDAMDRAHGGRAKSSASPSSPRHRPGGLAVRFYEAAPSSARAPARPLPRACSAHG